nr:diguanylate cyclase [Herbaspirillum sp. ASV7]
MITHFSHVYAGLQNLHSLLGQEKWLKAAAGASAILVQVYCPDTDCERLQELVSCLGSRLPGAVVVGASTVGEIAHGRLLTRQTVIGFTFFESSSLFVVALPCEEGTQYQAGIELARGIAACPGPVAGVLLLATPLCMDVAALLQGLEDAGHCHPVFGGGAGDYAAMRNSLVFAGSTMLMCGAVAVVLSGEELHLQSRTYLGWRPLSKVMRITEVDGLLVRTVDHRPAFEVYQRYLDIANDDDFFLNALEFPFLLERQGQLLARVPVAVTAEGALQFVADIAEGEAFRIGYGDPEMIVSDAQVIHNEARQFSPQAIFLFSCGCRRFLMQEDVALETLPFEDIAPSFGFYTYGEFFGTERLALLNSTMVVVSLREGPALPVSPSAAGAAGSESAPEGGDPYANKHARVVSRLMHFIGTVTQELETLNREVTKISVTDGLTQLANRIRLEQVLADNLALALREGIGFALILLDIDHFKQVNDTHGHMVGDDVLVRVAQILAAAVRGSDVVGRWGGEEFMVVAPATSLEQATWLAEQLRAHIAHADFHPAGRKTASFGVAALERGEDLACLLSRVDSALYEAKRGGRNLVRQALA